MSICEIPKPGRFRGRLLISMQPRPSSCLVALCRSTATIGDLIDQPEDFRSWVKKNITPSVG